MRLIERNPELVRNLWLELSAERLIIAPLVVGAVLLLCHFGAQNGLSLTIADGWLLAAIVIWAGYGTRLAAQSLGDEVVAGTWDAQRLSAVGSWQMALGKLFGGGVFAWYGGGLCLLVYLGIAGQFLPLVRLVEVALICVAAGVAAQSAMLLYWLGQIARNRRTGFASWPIWLLTFMAASTLTKLFDYSDGEPIIWWGLSVPRWPFFTVNLILLAGWLLIGLERTLRQTLRFRDPPWAWLTFLAFIVVWGYGFSLPETIALGPSIGTLPGGSLRLSITAGVLGSLSLAMIFYEPKDVLIIAGLRDALRARDPQRVLERLPLWSLTYAATVLLSLVAILQAPGLRWASMVLATLLFLLRDLGIVLGLHLRPNPRRADAAAVFCLLLLYGLAPALVAEAGSKALLPIFLPSPQDWLLSVVSALAQAGGMIWLLARISRQALARLER